jgi:subtilisin family serine protease
VSVLSTVPMGTGQDAVLTVGSSTYAPGAMEGSPVKTATAPLADFGIGDTVNTAVSGKVCLIAARHGRLRDQGLELPEQRRRRRRGVQQRGRRLRRHAGHHRDHIPSVTATDTDGAAMKGQLGQSATVGIKASNYAYFDGTSMATPHVSAVAALVWSYFPTCTGAQIRTSLNNSALDLGTAGRDTKYGFGLVQAKAAYDRIKSLGCGK